MYLMVVCNAYYMVFEKIMINGKCCPVLVVLFFILSLISWSLKFRDDPVMFMW